MKCRTRILKSDSDRLHRFLRPGALARLRDARIQPRTYNAPLPIAVSLPSSAAAPADVDSGRVFAARTYGVRVFQRKKLVAGKAVVIAPLDPVPVV